jgi:hypothetical protein
MGTKKSRESNIKSLANVSSSGSECDSLEELKISSHMNSKHRKMSSIGHIQGSNLLLPLTKKNTRIARIIKAVKFDPKVSEIFSLDNEDEKSDKSS